MYPSLGSVGVNLLGRGLDFRSPRNEGTGLVGYLEEVAPSHLHRGDAGGLALRAPP